MEPEFKRARCTIEKIPILDESTGQLIYKDEVNDVQYQDFQDINLLKDEHENTIDLALLTSNYSLNDQPWNDGTYSHLIDSHFDFIQTLSEEPSPSSSADVVGGHHHIVTSTTSKSIPHTQETDVSSTIQIRLTTPRDHLSRLASENLSCKRDTNKGSKRLRSELSCEPLRLPLVPPTKDEVNNQRQQQKQQQQQAISSSSSSSSSSSKCIATCQFCGRAMLKKNIATHIKRAHTVKEELVCLDEEHNIFTLEHLEPGQRRRRRRSVRTYDYNKMIATVHPIIDDDSSDEDIENKLIAVAATASTEEIDTADLLKLSDRIRYGGVSRIDSHRLNELVKVLTNIERAANIHSDIRANVVSIKATITSYLQASNAVKTRLREMSDEIECKRSLVSSLRAELKEIQSAKTRLERRIQPTVCDLQKLEDEHSHLVDSLLQNTSTSASAAANFC